MRAQLPTAFVPHFSHLNDTFLATLATEGLLQTHKIPLITNQVKEEKTSLISYLVQHQKIPSKIIAQQLAQYLKLEFFDLAQFHITDTVKEIIDEAFILQYQVLPLFIENHRLYLAISEPEHLDYMGEVKFHTDLNVCPVVVEWDKLMRLINTYLSESQYRIASQLSLSVENNDSVIVWVEKMLQDAVHKSASDIHIEPYKTAYRIRFRLDGILHKITQLPLEMGNRIIARLKVISRLDMAERRLPQDGRFTLETSKESKDCRISICPTLFGEKIVIRILDAEKTSLDIEDLGLEEKQKIVFLQAIKKQQGMILVTGPTGSGKTVTLYAALNFLNSLEKNICTVEDPVEITLPGINQIHVDPKIQLTFPKVLRSFLRQDPDIIMVGEIRDQETAETAVKAAQTGHLVLSTLHTNGAVETLSRLAMLGVSPFNIAHSIQIIIAQRLVRKLCTHCKKPKMYDAHLETKFNRKIINGVMDRYEVVGCDECMQGYKGRVAVFECLVISSEICALVVQGKSVEEIAAAAKNAGMLSLKESALGKIEAGVTTIEEIQRVIF